MPGLVGGLGAEGPLRIAGGKYSGPEYSGIKWNRQNRNIRDKPEYIQEYLADHNRNIYPLPRGKVERKSLGLGAEGPRKGGGSAWVRPKSGWVGWYKEA